MVSVLRTLQAEWNELVPQARELRIPRVRLLNAPLETIEYRRNKLDWLRSEVRRLSATTALSQGQAQDQDLSSLTFGVELEFLMTRHRPEAIASAIVAEGVPCEAELYNHTLRRHWKIVTDNSLGHNGLELVSPILQGQSGFDQLVKVCKVLKSMGAKVNKACGFHVHVGARGQNVDFFKNLVRLYHSAQDTIDQFMAPSRRAHNNGYCRPIDFNIMHLLAAQNVDAVVAAMGQQGGLVNARNSSRYKKLNLMSFWQHGTVEFRHHQGTIEADKAAQWVRLCLRMCLAAQNGKWQVNGFDALFDEVGATQGEKEFFAGRVQYFANRADETVARQVRGRYQHR